MYTNSLFHIPMDYLDPMRVSPTRFGGVHFPSPDVNVDHWEPWMGFGGSTARMHHARNHTRPIHQRLTDAVLGLSHRVQIC
jgi:hypothetical protein